MIFWVANKQKKRHSGGTRCSYLAWSCSSQGYRETPPGISFSWKVPFVHLTAFAIDVRTFSSAAKAWPLTVGIGCGGFLGRILVTRAADVCGVRLMFDDRFFLASKVERTPPPIERAYL